MHACALAQGGGSHRGITLLCGLGLGLVFLAIRITRPHNPTRTTPTPTTATATSPPPPHRYAGLASGDAAAPSDGRRAYPSGHAGLSAAAAALTAAFLVGQWRLVAEGGGGGGGRKPVRVLGYRRRAVGLWWVIVCEGGNFVARFHAPCLPAQPRKFRWLPRWGWGEAGTRTTKVGRCIAHVTKDGAGGGLNVAKGGGSGVLAPILLRTAKVGGVLAPILRVLLPARRCRHWQH